MGNNDLHGHRQPFILSGSLLLLMKGGSEWVTPLWFLTHYSVPRKWNTVLWYILLVHGMAMRTNRKPLLDPGCKAEDLCWLLLPSIQSLTFPQVLGFLKNWKTMSTWGGNRSQRHNGMWTFLRGRKSHSFHSFHSSKEQSLPAFYHLTVIMMVQGKVVPTTRHTASV